MIPPPPLNGGLYTGEPFLENAPWRNYPVIPSTAYLNHVNLRSANPPMQAIFQMGAHVRPGNNDSDPVIPNAKFVGSSNYGPFSSLMCTPCIKRVGCTCGYDCAKSSCPVDGCPYKWVEID